MTQTTPPRPQGQIETPNPVELFWEKHRWGILTVVAAAVVALGVIYGTQYIKQAEIDARWGAFATAANLDQQYISPEVPAITQLFVNPNQDPFTNQTTSLITLLQQQLGTADPAELESAIGEAAGTPAEPLLLWVAAHQASANRDWERAEGFLTDLQSRFADHPLCVETEYPVQYREPVEKDPPADPPPAPDPFERPELVPAVAGSQVSAALSRIRRDREFEQAESRFFQPIDPPEDSTKFLVTTSLGAFTIAFYDDRAPEHLEKFLELVEREEPFYDGQHIDEIARTPAGRFEPPVEEFHFGLESSKSQVRTTWNRTDPQVTEPLEFVDTPEQRELSHFPGTVSAAPEADGKSSAERYWINVNDCASSMDGTRVIVGRVIEGMDVLDLIVGAPFFTDAEATAGRGQPRELIRIESIRKL